MNNLYSLHIKNISKSFGGIHALNGISFDVKKGQIHALCGENGAGKSTMMKILSGELQKDKGEVLLDGINIHWNSPHDAIKGGVVIIPQELNPLLDMTIAENIFLGREPHVVGFLSKKKMYEDAKNILAYFDLTFDAHTKMKELSIAQIQLVEIAKAISYDSKVIIMDEPTSAIGEHEAKILFDIMRKLQKSNKTIIYISHIMKEIYTIADCVTILRDGNHIITTPLSDFPQEELVAHMIGKKLHSSYFVKPNPIQAKKPLLRVEHFTKKGLFHDVNFTLHQGEILGIFGLMGSGRSSMMRSLFGVIPVDTGSVRLYDKNIKNISPKHAIKSRLGFVTEDRKGTGLIVDHSVRDNASLPSLDRISFLGGIINTNEEKKQVHHIIDFFHIKVSSYLQQVVHLSGGNQQKVVLGKWALLNPYVFLLDEPTRGIDVGAKQEIYQFMNEYVKEGKGIIIISSELPEIMAMSHRILTFKKGSIVAEHMRDDFNQEKFMSIVS